jgi:Na+/H+ antiporter NhaA
MAEADGVAAGPEEPATPASRARNTPGRVALADFIATQNGSAVVLLAATLVALGWANSPWAGTYEHFWELPLAISLGDLSLSMSLRHWINDGLMALFFLAAGLEIRREFDMGELRERRRIASPVIAAIGGMAIPAILYLLLNAGGSAGRGWGIVMGTDTAFALGILTLVGGAWTPLTRTFLLTLVIVDDIAALTVIAIVYTTELSLGAVAAAVALYVVAVLMRRRGIRHVLPYVLVGAALWFATLASGVHATVAGLALGLLAYAYPPTRAELEQAGANWRLFREEPTPEYAASASRSLALAISPNERLQYLFHPWTSYVIVPLFALANAGVTMDGEVVSSALRSPVTLGVVLGLVVGKPLGITLAMWLFSRRRLGGLPLAIPWPPLVAAGTLGGIGFTVALLVATISLQGTDLEQAKIGILAASLTASALALVVFRLIDRLPPRLLTAGSDRVPAPIIDLLEPVDPAADHIRGPAEEVLTLVEYGDFECPHCGQAEPAIRQLLRDFGGELRFVFRHLPLVDVHPNAQLAAEAAEAAAAQGKFWEMHDLLFVHQSALGLADLLEYAKDLQLDVDAFERDLRTRRHARRIARDTGSAVEAGVAGTPTFFIDGRRHYGSFDLGSLTTALMGRTGERKRVLTGAGGRENGPER